MSRSHVGATVGRAAHDDGDVDESTRHVAAAGGVVDELVKGDAVEGPEHQLHDGANAEHGGSDAHADEAGF